MARAQSFQNPPLIPTEFDPGSIATADFNQDGIADLVYLDKGSNQAAGSIHVLLGNGDGTFTRGQNIAVSGGFCLNCAITVGDVTGDGKPDLIVGGLQNSSALVTVFVGNGDGTFQAPIVSVFNPPSSGEYPRTGARMAIGDVNGDGDADLVIPDPGNYAIYILTGDGSGHFTYASKLLDGLGPAQVELTDLNGDSHLDIVALGSLGAGVTVYLGNGDGTFATGVNYSTGISPENMVFTDLDGDGHPDVVTATYAAQNGNQVQYQIVYLKGNSDGTFAAPKTLVSSMQGTLVDVADYNGDGIPDLVTTNSDGIGIFLGQGNLTYEPQVSYLAASAQPQDVAFGTFRAAGHRDILMGVEGGILQLNGNGDGTFVSAPYYDLGNQAGAAAVADFNGDGNPDIAVTVPAEFPRVLTGKGDGTFQPVSDQNTSYGSGPASLNIAAGDFTGTGDADVAASSSGGPIATGSPEVFFGKDDGTFSAPVAETSGSSALADFNRDGRTDMIAVAGADITVSLGQANGTFQAVTTPLRNPTFAKLTAIGDVNGDGKPDIAISDNNGLEIWLDNGDGTFTYKDTLANSATEGLANGNFGSVAIVDLDGDGNTDLVFAPGDSLNSVPELSIYWGNGDGTFSAPSPYPVSHLYTGLVARDVNGDSKPDLILNDSLGISLLLNLGKRNLAPEQHFIAGSVIGSVTVADLNHDDLPDLVVSSGSGSASSVGTNVAVLLNQGTNVSVNPVPAGGIAISPEPSADLQTFQITLTLNGASQTAPLPTGTVSFAIDGGFLEDVPLTAGAAAFTPSLNLSVGTHTVTAAYSGDQNYGFATYSALHAVTPPVYATVTTLTATPASLLTSQTLRLQVSVTSPGPHAPGYVTFLDNGQTLAAVPLDANDAAEYDTSMLAASQHSITATYSGFITNNPYQPETFTPSTSSAVTVSVTNVGTTTTLTSSSSSPTSGTVLTLTATVASSAGQPFGGVTFYDGTTMLGTSSLLNGQTTFSTASLSSGSHSLSAAYNANAVFAASTSQAQKVTVQLAQANLIPTFTALLQQGGAGTPLTAHVSALSSIPQGIVTFLDDDKILGIVTLDASGTATLTSTPATAPGLHIVYASFGGSAAFAPSVSPALTQSMQSSAEFSLNLGADGTVLSPLTPATVPVLINASGSAPISLACVQGLPVGYACSFSPESLNGSGTSTMTISASPVSAQQKQPQSRWAVAAVFGLPLLLLIPVAGGRQRRWLLVLLVLLPLISAAGCNDTRALKTAPSSMTVLVVQASSGNGASAEIHSAQLIARVE